MNPQTPLQEGQTNINNTIANIATPVMTEQPVQSLQVPEANETTASDLQVNKKRAIPTKADVVQPVPLPTTSDDINNNMFGSQLKDIPNAGEYMQSRNKNIAQGIISKTPNVRDLHEKELEDVIREDLFKRGANLEDEEVAKNIENTVNTIKQQIRTEQPQYQTDDYYKRLVAGETLDNVDNIYSKQALNRYQRLNKYKSMDENLLSNSIQLGKLRPGSQTRQDLTALGMGNALQSALSQSRYRNKMKINNYLIEGTETDDTKSLLSQSKEAPDDITADDLTNVAEQVIGDMPEDQIQPFQQSLSEDQQIVQQTQKINEISKQEGELKVQLQRLRDDALAMSIKAGTGGLESGYLDAYVSEKSKPIIWKMEALASDKAAESNLLQTLVQNRQFKFEQERKQRQFAEDQRQFNLQFGQKQYEYNTDLQIKANQMMMDNWKETSDGNFINLATNEIKSPSQILQMQQQSNPQISQFISQDGSVVGQCATYTNDLRERAGEYGPFHQQDQSLAQKIKVTQDPKYSASGPVIGGTIVTDQGIIKNGKNYGHTETILEINGNKALVSGSNLTGDNKAYTRVIDLNDPKIKGFTRAPKGASGSQEVTKDNALIRGIGREFVETGKIPTEYIMKKLGGNPEDIIEQGVNLFIQDKNKGLSRIGFEITDPNVFISASDDQRKEMGTALKEVPSLLGNIDKRKTLVEKYGSETPVSDKGKEMQTLRTAILTQLKSPAFLNLGVLQQVDLDFMEGLVPNTTARIRPSIGNAKKLDNLRSQFLNKIKENGYLMGLDYIGDNSKDERGTNPYK